jgi:hypothetical protein
MLALHDRAFGAATKKPPSHLDVRLPTRACSCRQAMVTPVRPSSERSNKS